MKLSLKIFLGVCIPTVIAVILISMLLITSSHSRNLEWETQRCVQEFNVIEMNIKDVIKNKADKKGFVMAYADYYDKKGIDFIYYEDNKLVYNSYNGDGIKAEELINVKENQYNTKIQELENKHIIIISSKLEDNNVLMYVRDVSSIFNVRDKLIKTCLITTIILIALVALIAYIVSKTLTKPLRNMQKEMMKVSKGDYNVNLRNGKDEFGVLAKNFNNMSRELEIREKELTDLINSKQLFIDNLSHEINTPLTSILGYSELIQKAKCTPEQQDKFLRYIQEEANRIRNMHSKLLLLSYKKNEDLEKSNLDVGNIIDNVKIALKFKIENKDIDLIVDNKLKSLYGDKTLIIMCISNLISNAITASEEGQSIILRLYESNNKNYIEVIDNGKGISKKDLQKIIEPFYRVDKARSRKEGGAGLGLSICKSIMEMHEGDLKIESELGKGSTFILEFPKKC